MARPADTYRGARRNAAKALVAKNGKVKFSSIWWNMYRFFRRNDWRKQRSF